MSAFPDPLANPAILRSLAEGVVVHDPRGVIVACNPAAYSILGADEDGLVGVTTWDAKWQAVGENGQPMATEDHPSMRTLADGQPITGAVMGLRRPDGALVWLRVNTQLLRDAEGRSTGVVSSFSDISSQRRNDLILRNGMELISRAKADLERFSHAAAHDLKEPARGISIAAQRLERELHDVLSPDAHAQLKAIHQQALDLYHLIGDMGIYLRLEREADRHQPVDLTRVAHAAVHPFLADHRPDRTFHIGPLPVVAGDEGQLLLVFSHLVGNAVKFRTPGIPLRVDISARDYGCTWEITVADNGIGFDPAYKDYVFDVFRRLHSTAIFPGSGLGLSLSRRIIDLHGGMIDAHSTPGQGTRIVFNLPRMFHGAVANAPR